MSFVQWKLEWTPFANNTWDSDDTLDLTNFKTPIMNLNLGDGRDSFNFNIKNFNSEFDGDFNAQDRIIVYRSVDTDIATTDDIIMSATIQNVKPMESSSKNQTKIECYNYTESVAGAIVFIDEINKTPAEIVQDALKNAGSKNSNFQVTWNSGNDAAISALTFPTYTDKLFNKPLRQILEKYSMDKFTANGDFYYYVDNNNTLVWRPKSTTIDSSFNYTTDACKGLKVGKDIKDVKNFFVLKGGYDPTGSQIYERFSAWSSIATHGTKYQMIVTETNTSKDLIDQDIKNTYGITGDVSPDGFPNITSASFTTDWASNIGRNTDQTNKVVTTKSGITITNGCTITINLGSESANKDGYVEVIRTEVKERLKTIGSQLSKILGNGKLQVDLTFRAGEKTWGLGSNIDCTLPQIDNKTRALRVEEVQYAETMDTFSLKEDTGTL